MLKSLRPTVADGCISDLTIDAWRAGELDAERTGALEQHLALCEGCRRRQESIAGQASRFWAQAPELRLPARAASGKAMRRRWLAPSALTFSALAAIVVWLRLPTGSREDPEESRRKGSSHIAFHVQHEGSVKPGKDGQRVFPGDRLRFSISTGKPAHVAILSLDGAGVASIYFPQGKTSRGFGMVSGQPLDSSVLLDGTLGPERLWALFCDSPFDLEPLRAQLERQGEMTLPAGCSVDQHTIVKQAAP
jgi:hypothetical protein